MNNRAPFSPPTQLTLYDRPPRIAHRGLRKLTNNMVQIINYYKLEKDNDDDDNDDDNDDENHYNNDDDDHDDDNPRENSNKTNDNNNGDFLLKNDTTSDGNNDTTSNSKHADEGSGFSATTKKDSDKNTFVVNDAKGEMSKEISDTNRIVANIIKNLHEAVTEKKKKKEKKKKQHRVQIKLLNATTSINSINNKNEQGW